MIWAVTEPAIGGTRVHNCDVLVWEQVSTNPSRCHEGLLQLFLKGPVYPMGEWVTFGRLLCQADTWDQMRKLLRQTPLHGKRVLIFPANDGRSSQQVYP